MKEIGIFKIDKNMCSNCREDEDCPQKYSVNGNCLNIEKDLAKEQVPENFEELKELCKGLKGNKKDLGGAMWFEFPIPKDSTLWLGKFLCVDIKGQVGIAEKSFGDDVSITIFAENRTPQQMWQIIKNLIGE